jgi:predicted TIM-barrel fold metal-dependent hydrolase
MLTRRAMLGQVSAAASAAWVMQAGVAVGAAGRTAVDFDVPRGACDCHVHVFGDPTKFPFAEKRVYTPPQASVEQLLELQRDLHLDRVVVVQPSVYGADNACTLDAVRRMGARARGVAVIDRATSRKALEEMAAAGIRGVRLNLETNTAGRFDPADAKAVLDATVEQIRGLGWHVQIYTRTAVIAGLKDHLGQMPFPVVVDHFGRGNPGQGPGQPDFVALLDLVKSGRVYVKVSGAYRVSERAPDFADVTALAQALVGQSRSDCMGFGLASSEFGCGAWKAVDRNFLTVPYRRWPVAQPTAEVGAGCGGPQEDPGRQSGPALWVRGGRRLGRREQGVDLGAVRRPRAAAEARTFESRRGRGEAHGRDFGLALRKRERESAVENVAGAQRVDRLDREHRAPAQCYSLAPEHVLRALGDGEK